MQKELVFAVSLVLMDMSILNGQICFCEYCRFHRCSIFNSSRWCLQEHYCVTVGMNDATGAFSQFGLTNNASPRRDVPNAD